MGLRTGGTSERGLRRLVALAARGLVVPPADAAPIVVSSVTPDHGPDAGGTALVIRGSGFLPATGVAVHVLVPASFVSNVDSLVVVDDTEIHCTTQAFDGVSSRTKAVRVMSPSDSGLLAGAFVFVAAPSLVGISPAVGPVGGGTHVVAEVVDSSVVDSLEVDGTPVTGFNRDDATHISGDTVAHAVGAVNVTASGPGGTSSPLVGGFTYQALVTITSVTRTISDPLGGSSHVITGTGFGGLSGASVVKFLGTNATSYTVDSPTQITAVSPAHVAGAGTLSVTGPSNSATVAFEYWDPTVPSTPTAFLDKGGYSIGPPGAGLGRWAKRAGSVVADWDSQLAGTTPAASSGMPVFPVSPGNYGMLRTGKNVGDWIGYAQANGCTMAAVLDLTTVLNTAAAQYNTEAIFADNLFRCHLGFHLSGGNKVLRFYWYAGGYRILDVTIPSTGRLVIVVERDVTTNPGHPRIKITINGSTWTTDTVDTGDITSGDSATTLGWASDNSQPTVYLSAWLKAFVTVKSDWSASDVAKFYEWAAARHP